MDGVAPPRAIISLRPPFIRSCSSGRHTRQGASGQGSKQHSHGIPLAGLADGDTRTRRSPHGAAPRIRRSHTSDRGVVRTAERRCCPSCRAILASPRLASCRPCPPPPRHISLADSGERYTFRLPARECLPVKNRLKRESALSVGHPCRFVLPSGRFLARVGVWRFSYSFPVSVLIPNEIVFGIFCWSRFSCSGISLRHMPPSPQDSSTSCFSCSPRRLTVGFRASLAVPRLGLRRSFLHPDGGIRSSRSSGSSFSSGFGP
jgi:hypothetical protein